MHETEVSVEQGWVELQFEVPAQDRNGFQQQTQAAHDPEVMTHPHPSAVSSQPLGDESTIRKCLNTRLGGKPGT